MTEAIFGLLGVIVGGVLQVVTSWAAERHRRNWEVRKAGRLFAPKLAHAQYSLLSASKEDRLWELVARDLQPAVAAWDEHAASFAALRVKDWNELAQAVMQIQRIEQAARVLQGPIDEEYREFLGRVAGLTMDAMLTSALVGVTGPQRSRLHARLIRLRHPDHDFVREAEEIVKFHPDLVVEDDDDSESLKPD